MRAPSRAARSAIASPMPRLAPVIRSTFPFSVAMASSRLGLACVELQNVEAGVAVDEVDEPTLIHIHVVGLRRGLASGGLGDVPAHFLRRERIGDVDDAQAAREPGAVDERAFHVLLE